MDTVKDTVAKAMNRERGVLLGFIEALGLPEDQERGAKATIKTLSYQSQKEVLEALKAHGIDVGE